MADILQFPQLNAGVEDNVKDLLDAVEELLFDYSAEQIILALMHHATDEKDINAILPSFSKIVNLTTDASEV